MGTYYVAVDGELHTRNFRYVPLMEDVWVCVLRKSERHIVSFHRSQALALKVQRQYSSYWDSAYILPTTTDRLAARHEQLRQMLGQRRASNSMAYNEGCPNGKTITNT